MVRFLLVLLLPALMGVAPAVHTRLARSEPAAGATVSAPSTLRLWFEGGAEGAFTRVRLRTGAGVELALGAPTRGPEQGLTVVPVPVALAAGPYVVAWETVGRDGHPVRGEFRFAVRGDPGAVGPTPPAAIDSAAFGAGAAGRTATGAPIAAEGGRMGYPPLTRPVRWLELSALVVAIGAVAVLLLMLGPQGSSGGPEWIPAARARAQALAGVAAATFLVATLVRLGLESQTLHQTADALGAESLRRTIRTVWGRGWLVGVGAGTTLLLALLSVRLGGRGAMAGLALAAILLAGAPALTGHAVGTPDIMGIAIAADWLHVLGASAWIGGIAVVVVALLPCAVAAGTRRAAGVAWLIERFHRLATGGVAVVVASGLASSWVRLGSWRALTTTNYGEVLLFKVFVVLFVALLGAYHWTRARRRLLAAPPDDARAVGGVRATLLLEVAVGCLVMILTSVLATTQPPR